MKSNRQKQRFCHPKMADLKAWSHGVRKANLNDYCNILVTTVGLGLYIKQVSFHSLTSPSFSLPCCLATPLFRALCSYP